MTLRVLSGEDETDQMAALLDRLEALSTTLETFGVTGGRGQQVMDTLSRMEKRDLHAVSAIDTFATALRSVSQHLAHVRQAVHQDNAQNAAKLEGLAERFTAIEARLQASLSGGIDLTPLATSLETIAQRLTGLEAKLDALPPVKDNWPFDADAFAGALASIADRLARVESKVDSVAQQPALEPQATTDLLSTIAQRVSRVEQKVDSGADGTSIAACLLAVDRRLSRIEGGLGMDRPMPAVAEIPDLAAVVAEGEQGHAPHQAEEPLQAPAPLPDEDGRERVDILLEQVFKVLAR